MRATNSGRTSTVYIQLFGRFCLWRDGEIINFKSQPLKELFCYFLITGDREHSREGLASELWGDRSTAQSLKNLRQALWQLDTLLKEKSITEIRITNREFPQLELQPSVQLDILQLEQAQHILDQSTDLTSKNISTLKTAAELYRGDLLEGWHKEWCLIERERYQNLYLAVLDKLVELCLQNREIHAGLRYAQRILALEPARECTHRQMMELYLLVGNRTAALRQFDRCATLLKEEYDVKPSRTTAMVFQRARDDQVDGQIQAFPPVTSAQQDVMHALQQILNMLSEMKRLLQH